MERGTIYSDIAELFNFVEDYVGREPSAIGSKDIQALVDHFETWFADEASPRRIFVPCVISRTPAPRFEIGSVTFEFIDRAATGDFYPHGGGEIVSERHGFDKLLKWMREQDADWPARISVDGCERKRAEEIAELAVDLAIVALQLAAPMSTRAPWRGSMRGGERRRSELCPTLTVLRRPGGPKRNQGSRSVEVLPDILLSTTAHASAC
jgi:hypothetical protein